MVAEQLLADTTRALPVRPRPEPGEATMGYLARVAVANGHVSMARLHTTLRHPDLSAFEFADQLLALTKDECERLAGPVPRAWGQARMPVGTQTENFNGVLRRWCPVCLENKPVIRWEWTLKLMCVCVQHAVRLRDECPRCRQPQRWGSVSIDRCECGAALASEVGAEAPKSVIAVCAALSGGVPVDGPFSVLTATDWHRAIVYLGQLSAQPMAPRPGKIAGLHRLAVAAELVGSTAELLDQWPRGFVSLLSSIHQQALACPSIRRTFSPLYRVLYEELRSAAFEFMRDVFEEYLREHWWGVICKRNRHLKASTVDSHPRVTLNQAARASQLRPSVVRHLAQAELIPAAEVPLPSGRQARTVHFREVGWMKAAAGGAVSLCEAARLLALPERRLRELIAAGVVKPLISRQSSRSSAAWLISRAEVDRLQPTTARTTVSTGVSLGDVLKYWRLRREQAEDLVRAIVDGRITSIFCGNALQPLGKARFDPAELHRWFDTHRTIRGADLSVDQAAKALGVKQQVGYALVRQGLLSAIENESQGLRVTEADIDEFQLTYVSLAEMARAARRSPRAMLETIGAKPICGPRIDGSRQYFFRRADLPAQPLLSPRRRVN
jgi:predicted HTH domain antitoxin